MFNVHDLVPEFWCSDFEESLRFYIEVLGFSVTQQRGNDRHAYLERGSAQLMLAHWEQDGVWEPAPLKKPYGRGVSFFMLVEDVHALYEAVLSAGVKPFVELHTRCTGEPTAWMSVQSLAYSTQMGTYFASHRQPPLIGLSNNQTLTTSTEKTDSCLCDS